MTLVLFWLAHPPVVKWLVKKYGPEYTGRQVTLDHFRLNPLNGVVTIRGLKMMEAEGDSTFLSVEGIRVDLTPSKMLFGMMEIAELHVDRPFVRVVQDGDRFNFSDILDMYSDDPTEKEGPDEPFRFALYDIQVDSASLSYRSALLPAPFQVTRARFTCPQVIWNVPLIEALLQLDMLNGTGIELDLDLDQVELLYALHVTMNNAPCDLLASYVEPFMDIGGLDGTLHADLLVKGDGNDPVNFSMKGTLGATGFALKDPNGVKLVGLGGLELVVDTVDVMNEVYRVRRFLMDEPYLFVELYDDGDNFSRLLTEDSSATTELEEELGYDPENPFSIMSYYVNMLAENYSTMSYSLDSMEVSNGSVLFNDHTLYHTFRYAFTELEVHAHGMSSSSDRMTIRGRSKLNKYGDFEAELALDPTTLRNFELEYTVDRMGLPDFAPYTITHVAHPIMNGLTRYESRTVVVDNKLTSENKIHVEDMDMGSRMDVPDAYSLPVRLAVSLMKDVHGNIDLNIPVEGDLDDPEYKVWPIVWQVLKNLITKAVSAPITMLARAFDADEEDLRAVHFTYLQEELEEKQVRSLNILSRVIEGRPELRVELVRTGDPLMEAESYAILQARAAYYADSTGTSSELPHLELGELVQNVDIRSTGFLDWLERTSGPSDAPVQTRCLNRTGSEVAMKEATRLSAARTEVILNYLTNEKGISKDAFVMRERVDADTIASGTQPAYFIVIGLRNDQQGSVGPDRGQ